MTLGNNWLPFLFSKVLKTHHFTHTQACPNHPQIQVQAGHWTQVHHGRQHYVSLQSERGELPSVFKALAFLGCPLVSLPPTSSHKLVPEEDVPCIAHSRGSNRKIQSERLCQTLYKPLGYDHPMMSYDVEHHPTPAPTHPCHINQFKIAPHPMLNRLL